MSFTFYEVKYKKHEFVVSCVAEKIDVHVSIRSTVSFTLAGDVCKKIVVQVFLWKVWSKDDIISLCWMRYYTNGEQIRIQSFEIWTGSIDRQPALTIL